MTPKQARFVEEYLVDQNGTQAAIRAGYSKRGAEVTASRLLRNPKIAKALSVAQGEARERTFVTIETLTEKMLAVYAGASGDKQWGAAQQALMGLGKLHGLIIDRKHLSLFDKPFDQWTMEEKIAVRDKLREHHGSTGAVH